MLLFIICSAQRNLGHAWNCLTPKCEILETISLSTLHLTQWELIGSSHLLPFCVICTDVGELAAHIEEHIILTWCPFLHEVCGEHPCPEHYAVILEAPLKKRKKKRFKLNTVNFVQAFYSNAAKKLLRKISAISATFFFIVRKTTTDCKHIFSSQEAKIMTIVLRCY